MFKFFFILIVNLRLYSLGEDNTVEQAGQSPGLVLQKLEQKIDWLSKVVVQKGFLARIILTNRIRKHPKDTQYV